MTKGSDRSFST